MYWDVYAFIFQKMVKRICVFEPNGSYTLANEMAMDDYGPDAIAVRVNDYPIRVDDIYDNGAFYRNGEIVEKLPSTDDQINKLELAIAELGSLVGGSNG